MRYILTCSQNFYGQRDAKTYYNVKASKVWAGCQYMTSNFNAPAVFIYLDDREIGRNTYIGCYSAKWRNVRTPDGKTHSTYSF